MKVAVPREVRTLSRTRLAAGLRGARHALDLTGVALRSRSPEVLDALVDMSGFGPGGMDRLREALDLTTPVPPPSEQKALVVDVPSVMVAVDTAPYTAALTAALIGWGDHADRQRGMRLAAAVLQTLGPEAFGRTSAMMALQASVLEREPDLALAWLAALDDFGAGVADGVRADLLHPGLYPVSDDDASYRRWETALSEPMRRAGLSPVRVDKTAAVRFDGLMGAPSSSVEGPLISVIMPTFRPDEGLITSVRSLLAQSHQNLEIVVVDDCSGAESAAIYSSVEHCDPRVEVVHLETNSGAYLARNAGVAVARGDFIAFQDGDDWSHPERLRRQVQPLMADPSVPATLSRAIRATEDLVCTWVGATTQRTNASSLVMPRATWEAVGDFLPVRKGGDSEFEGRIRALLGEITVLPEPLAITRLRGGSLSRSDFRPGWHSPDRVNFRNTFRHWHRSIPQRGSDISPESPGRQNGTLPFPVPRRFRERVPGSPLPADRLGTVFMTDASVESPLSEAGGDQRALLAAPGPLGVVHLEDFGTVRRSWVPFREGLLDLAQAGDVELIAATDRVECATLVVLHPGSLEFAEVGSINVRPDRLLSLLPTSRLSAVDLLAATDRCRQIWGLRPTWCALDQDGQRAWEEDGWQVPLLGQLLADQPSLTAATNG